MMGIWPTRKPAVLAAVTILEAAFAGVASVSTKLPRPERPERFVVVSRVGGSQDDVTTDKARILVECFGKDTYNAEMMCSTASAALHNARGSAWEAKPIPTEAAIRMFIRWYGNEAGPVDLPHPDVLDYERWQFNADLWIKAN